ncbi:MAG TPA: hydantoinase B/oxoprolinase family protein, partial [Polyangia bacterium]|nr:hydantoinase B/oxoprolinase family protein [Polyangia bacterium]
MTTATTPAELEIWNHRLAQVAEEMGVALARAAFSPNIKERRDYSCALFDAGGRLVAQAAHIPVHLGSTALSVAAVLERLTLGDGEIAIVNDPYAGGTHLPDITLVRPVFAAVGVLLGYVANSAHHAD